MEIHAHVPKIGKSPGHWLLEGLFIVVSVGLAFGVGEYREYRSNRELAARVLRSLQSEVEYNLREIEPYLAMHRAWADALERADTAKGNQSGLDAYGALRPPLPSGNQAEFPTEVRRGAWDAALSTGALRLIDYDVVAALSEIYQVQTFYGESINRLIGAATSISAFDPASRSLSVRQLSVNMGTVAFADQLLVGLYKQHLPALRAAVKAAE
jgi:hypothetical protein